MKNDNLKNHDDLYETIKSDNPVLFSILKDQQKRKWEIVTGDTYQTSGNTADKIKKEILEKTLNYYSI